MTSVARPAGALTPNSRGEIIDRQCPICGAWATEHTLLANVTVAPGLKTMAEIQRLPGTHDLLQCEPLRRMKRSPKHD